MNKSVIKNFAVSARVKLIEAIEQKAYELGITRKEIKEPEVYQDGFRINGKFFKKYQMKQRNKLLQRIKDQGFDQVIEEVAYTWFNRLIAIRFMEVNEYLPTGVRVLSSIDKEKIEPDAVTEVLTISEDLDLDLEVVYRLQDENNSEELFKYILVKQCNKLGEIMPVMFEQIEDYTELLLPDYLLSEGSVVRDLVSMIDEEDWKEQVEIIGWLYQYYISEKKDQVFADLKKNKKITKENIPAATQLFTPKWIVKYMVENSLGRLWLESHPNEELQKEWKYYLEEAEQEPQVQEQLEKLKNKQLSPEDIKVLDPCMGSGHILVYAFDVLYKIYKSAGYPERDIPQLILEKNLYGLDIDDRAAQLAYFALMMKARSYNRRIFRKKIELNVCAIQESNGISEEAIEYFIGNSFELEGIKYLRDIFINSKEYGSILEIKSINVNSLNERLKEIYENYDNESLFELGYREILLEKIPLLIKQGNILSNKYNVIITNPPYMGRNGMNQRLKNYVDSKYPLSKQDFFSIFMEVCFRNIVSDGKIAMINQHSWMFLSTFESIRKYLLNNFTIVSMIHLGAHAFEEIGGEIVQSTAFVLHKNNVNLYHARYIRLVNYNNANKKREEFFNYKNEYISNQNKFKSIPLMPIAYWISPNIRKIFLKNIFLQDVSDAKVGLSTGDNERCVRSWFEVEFDKIGMYYDNSERFLKSKQKWVPFNKGGTYRKWFGNNQYVLNWENDGYMVKSIKNSTIRNEKYYFKCGITWSDVSTSKFAARYTKNGFVFADSGPCLFTDQQNVLLILGLLNCKITNELLHILNPTIHYKPGNISNIPFKYTDDDSLLSLINNKVKSNINLCEDDWNSNEISWEFKKHPFLSIELNSNSIQQVFFEWKRITVNHLTQLKENEEELNHIFLDLYRLENEFSPTVEYKDLTLKKADKVHDVKSFISYMVGCLLGRYSLDQEGLVFAGGEFDESKYVTFKADADNIIPITDDEYFEDDIVSRFIDFVRITFGQDTLEENLDFIADALTRKANETSRQRIRRYFVKEFYKDHVHTYQKRPIYWLFDSGKNDGFKALIYMHRYDAGTVARIRTDYLHTLQRKYEAEISRLDLVMEADVSAQEKTRAKKQKEKIQKQLLECQQYDQVIAHVANQKIKIDLDDGVKVNYAKFQSIEVPQGEGKKPLNADLLAKI